MGEGGGFPQVRAMVNQVSPRSPVACPDTKSVATSLWAKCEDETHTLKSGNLKSFGTPATSELNSRGQNTLP